MFFDPILRPNQKHFIKRLMLLVVTVCLASVIHARSGYADSTDKAIDWTINTLALGGTAIGVQVTPADAAILKPVIKCAVKGKSVLDCAKDAVIEQLPAETREVTDCIISGGNVVGCAKKQLINKLPPETRGLAQCVADGGNVTACSKTAATDLVAKNLPPEARALANCITSAADLAQCARDQAVSALPFESRALADCLARGGNAVECGKNYLPPGSRDLASCIAEGKTDVTECARKQAISALPPESQPFADCLARGNLPQCAQLAKTAAEKAIINEVVGIVDKYKFEAAEKFAAGSTPIQSIMCSVQGIVEEDWGKVITCGGEAVAKVAIHAVISAFATPAISSASTPIVNYLVDARSALLQDLYNAIKAEDYATIARIAAEAYLASSFEIVCAAIPEGAVKEATCGTLGKLIGVAGKIVKGAATAVVDAVGAALDTVGGIFSDGIDLTRKTVAGKKSSCGIPAQYYANNVLPCYNQAASVGLADPSTFKRYSDEIYNDCRRHFIACEFSGDVTSICLPMKKLYDQQVDTLQQAFVDSAAGYARSQQSFFSKNRSQFCGDTLEPGLSSFTSQCRAALDRSYPQAGGSCREPLLMAGTLPDVKTASETSCRWAGETAVNRILTNLCVNKRPVKDTRPPPLLVDSSPPGVTGETLLKDAPKDPVFRDPSLGVPLDPNTKVKDAGNIPAFVTPKIANPIAPGATVKEAGRIPGLGNPIDQPANMPFFVPPPIQETPPSSAQDICQDPNKTVLIARLQNGLRIIFELARDGDKIQGMAKAWQPDGRMTDSGVVNGYFGGDVPNARGLLLNIWWQNGGNLVSSYFKGVISAGAGRGTVTDPEGRTAAGMDATLITSGPCKWPDQKSPGATANTPQENKQIPPLGETPVKEAGKMPTLDLNCPDGWSGEHPVCCKPAEVYKNGACQIRVVTPTPPLFEPKCPVNWSGVHPNCCQPGTMYRNGICETVTLPIRCDPGLMGVPPYCCRQDEFLSNGGSCGKSAPRPSRDTARAEPCGGGMVGVKPNCRCRTGQRLRDGRCVWPVKGNSEPRY
ncbi:MAG: hypothetical protein H7X92_05445, partial [Chitinophagales bacterium]|nr:hypothetical protein [Hyphomicrobiales bacterium]